MPKLPFWAYAATLVVLTFGSAWIAAPILMSPTADHVVNDVHLPTGGHRITDVHPPTAATPTRATEGSDRSYLERGPGNRWRDEWSHGRAGAEENAEEHWRKHSGDFPNISGERQYERAANSFVENPPPGTLIKHRANGDTVFYNPDTNIVAVTNDEGKPRTFFKPRGGKRYWERQ